MTDRERLLQWMQEKGFDLDSLAEVTDDSFSNLYLMLVSQKNARPISDKFKWRFAQHFGWEETGKVFADAPRPTVNAMVAA